MSILDKSRTSTQTVALVGILVALALIFSYIEVLIPFNFGIPGVKLGLANLVIVISFYMLSVRDTFIIECIKIAVTSFLFGTFMSFMYSLCGGLLSFIVMLIMKKTSRFSTMGISIAGGVFHNIGQLGVAVVILGTPKLMYYLPVLLVSGLVTGALIGIIAGAVLNRIGHLSKSI